MPDLLDITVREATKKLNKEGEKFTLERVIEITIILTAICLANIIYRPGLISNVGDRANVAVAVIKNLSNTGGIRGLVI